jgi:hypothetical protein
MKILRQGPLRQARAAKTQANPASARARNTASPASTTRTNTTRNADAFEASTRGATRTSAATTRSSSANNLPAEVPTGTQDYYRRRHDDFVRRNPGVTPPAYYMEYGQKYLERFNSMGPKDLSPKGLEWRDKTLKALQDAIETKRMEDPVAFAQLERDPEAFKRFCYDTHAQAYLQSGLLQLPAQDLLKIATTPDLRDLLNKDGLRQIADVLGQMKPADLLRIGGSTALEFLRNYKPLLPPLIRPLPLPLFR